MELAAILIAPNGAGGALRGLVDRLAGAGVTMTIVDELTSAVDLCADLTSPPCILVDLCHASSGEAEDLDKTTETIRRVLAVLPYVLPVVVLAKGDATTILACIRAGAGDVLDLQLEGTATARAVVQRICHRQSVRATELDALESQRSMIEDLFKDLIKTERRSIDVEERLAAHTRISGEHPALEEIRPPAVLLVEHDRVVADELADLLEAAGVATFAYVTGEEAVREAETLSTTTGLDLALVAAQLPGIDGLETVRRLRNRVADLPAFLMTSVHDADLAAEAADLGVVGFVHKPFPDIDEVVARLAQLARESLHKTREGLYLQRIKERHERVLARYRSLPRDA